MAIDFRGDSNLEMDALVSEEQGLGIDGVFVDCPQSAARWKRAFLKPQDPGSVPPAAHSPRISVDAGDEGDVVVEPAAAISTYAIVGVLIAACGVYACMRKPPDGSVHGTYKVMTSPRVEDDGNDGAQRDSQQGSQHGKILEME